MEEKLITRNTAANNEWGNKKNYCVLFAYL